MKNQLITAMVTLLVIVSTCAEPSEGTSPETFAEWTRMLKGVDGAPKWAIGKLDGFAGDYQSRIAANPNDYEARLLHAAALIAALGENETLKECLRTFGFEINYLGLKLSGEESDPSAWPAANELVDAVVTQCAPVLQAALADLMAIPDGWTGEVHLDSATWPLDEDVYVDVSDVLYARAGIESLLGTLYFLKGYDLTVDWAKVRSLDKPTIPVLESAPSMSADKGWDGALTWRAASDESSSASCAVQVAFNGMNLYLRVNDTAGFDDVDSLDGLRMDCLIGSRAIPMYYTSWSGKFTVNNGSVPRPKWTEGMEWSEYNQLYNLYVANDIACPMEFFRSTNSLVIKVYIADAGIDDDIGKMVLDDAGITLQRPNRPRYQWGSVSDYYSFVCNGKLNLAPLFQREPTNFLSTVRNHDSLAVSKEWMRSALTDSLAAYVAMTNRVEDGKYRFIEYDPAFSNQFAVARTTTEKALVSLDAAVTIDCVETFGKYNPDKDYTLLPNNGVMQVYLGALFSGRFNRDLIPTLDLDKYATLEPVGTISDATFGGVFPQVSSSQWITTLDNYGIAHGLTVGEPLPIFTIENGVLTAVELNGVTEVVIPDGVTSIGHGAFSGCSSMTSIVIPGSVAEIGDSAFWGCSTLTDLTISEGVSYIRYYAFGDCPALTNVVIPASVEYMGGNAFSGCTGIMAFQVAEGNMSYKAVSGLLLSKDGSVIVAVPSGLTNITIPEGVVRLKDLDYAFEQSQCQRIVIPSSMTDWSVLNMIWGLDELLSYEVSEGNATFKSDSGLLLTKDGKTLLAVPRQLENVLVPNGVTNISTAAFIANNSCLSSVTLPDSVLCIGDGAFYGSSFDGESFQTLTNIIFAGNAPSIVASAYFPDDAQGAFRGVNDDCVVYVRRGSTGWGVDIPGTWQGMRIEYLDEEPVATTHWIRFVADDESYNSTYNYVYWRIDDGDYYGYEGALLGDSVEVPDHANVEIGAVMIEGGAVTWNGGYSVSGGSLSDVTSDLTVTIHTGDRRWIDEFVSDFHLNSAEVNAGDGKLVLSGTFTSLWNPGYEVSAADLIMMMQLGVQVWGANSPDDEFVPLDSNPLPEYTDAEMSGVGGGRLDGHS